MAKPLKYYQTLNQAPRSVKNGKHRRAGSPAHGRTIVGADHSAGGADESTTVWVTWHPGTVTYPNPFAFSEPEPPAIPYAGIRTGELIGHRLWWVLQEDGEQWLSSLAHRRLWQPDETVSANVDKVVDDFGLWIGPKIWGGTYAFADAGRLDGEAMYELLQIERWRESVKRCGMGWYAGWVPYAETATFVAGTIKMWGEVIEHETGFRAQFAKLNSIDRMYGPGDLAALQEKYTKNTHD